MKLSETRAVKRVYQIIHETGQFPEVLELNEEEMEEYKMAVTSGSEAQPNPNWKPDPDAVYDSCRVGRVLEEVMPDQ